MFTLLQIVFLLLGLIALYLATFAYEKKQKARIGNKVEDWWIKVVHKHEYYESVVEDAAHAISFALELRSIPFFLEEVFSVQSIVLCASLATLSGLCLPVMSAIAAHYGLGWHNPFPLIRMAEDKQLREVLGALIFLLPLSFLVAYLSAFFVGLSVALARWIRAIPGRLIDFFSRGPRVDLLSLFPGERIASLWVWFRKALPPAQITITLKGLVAALQKLLVGFILLDAVLLGIPFILFCLLGVLLLTVPLLAVWFGGLSYFTLRIVAPGILRLPLIFVVLVPVAGISTSAGFLITMRWVVSQICWASWEFTKEIWALLSMVLLASLLCFGPLAFVRDGWRFRPPPPAQLAATDLLSSIVRYIAYCNLADVIFSYSFVSAGLFLVAHRLSWPYLRHSLMALRLAGVGFSRLIWFELGLACLLVSSGQVGNVFHYFMDHPEIYEKIEKLFTHFDLLKYL